MHARRWIRIAHRVSAVLLAIFLAAHLLNHVVALGGIAAHLAFMEGARLVYRSPALEPMLLAAVLVQIVTGVEQVRAGWGTRRGFWQRTQAVSGLYLAFFLANHTFWVLVARVGYGLDSNFYLAATFLTIWPLPLLFAPYYALGVSPCSPTSRVRRIFGFEQDRRPRRSGVCRLRRRARRCHRRRLHGSVL